MIVAYITTEKEAIAALFTKDYEDFFAATPWLYLFACMLVLFFGPGRLDRCFIAEAQYGPIPDTVKVPLQMAR